MTGQIEVGFCQEGEWQDARECLVRAFHRYPLYSYLIPNDAKRKIFLSRYLDAIHEVTVRRGSSVLICVKLRTERTTSSFTNEVKKIIGAVLLVPPSSNGGWECAKDEDFWDAYEKYKLKEVDEDSFNKIKRYEEWEYENITKCICNSGIPMWNGILCGIDPDYASKGWGNVSYNKCLRLILKLHNEKMGLQTIHPQCSFHSVVEKLTSMFDTDSTYGSQPISGLLVKIFHSLSMLSRRAPIIYPDCKAEHQTDIFSSAVDGNCKYSRAPPIVFALSHSIQSVYFHHKNGFCPIVERPYKTLELGNKVAFIVQAMVMRLCESQQKSLPPRIIPCITAHLKGPEILQENAILLPEGMHEEESMPNYYIVSTV